MNVVEVYLRQRHIYGKIIGFREIDHETNFSRKLVDGVIVLEDQGRQQIQGYQGLHQDIANIFRESS